MPFEWEAISMVEDRLGMTPETLRRWVRQAAVDAGEAEGASSQLTHEDRELTRKSADVGRTIEILKATSFFVRESDPRPRWSAGSSPSSPTRPSSSMPSPDGSSAGSEWSASKHALFVDRAIASSRSTAREAGQSPAKQGD
ncbi:hypothetical protein E0H92_26890 [Kribbella speibonae]|uniref:Transposase n=1 Tax=Kribbella speibonae TaxID=1572660 RepID=A0A4V2M4K9_9ACTN|nr:hypothetical protein E0H92_26890 [Kribbella speibonae]